jgi:hypothetical protein
MDDKLVPRQADRNALSNLSLTRIIHKEWSGVRLFA